MALSSIVGSSRGLCYDIALLCVGGCPLAWKVVGWPINRVADCNFENELRRIAEKVLQSTFMCMKSGHLHYFIILSIILMIGGQGGGILWEH